MSLYIYSNPFENSLFDVFDNDVFDNDVFNNNLFNDDDLSDSLIPYSTLALPCRSTISRRIRHNNRWSPYKKLEKQMKKQMKKLFKEENKKLVDFNPNINLTEDEDNYYIHADLPGMTKDQVKMELDYEDHILTISGERKSIYKDNNGKTEKEEKDQKQKEEKKEDKEKEEDKENEEETTSNNETDESNENETKLTKQAENSKEIQKKNNCRYSVMECSYGSFSRSFTIPEDANIDNIKAKMENGVLNITINKIKEQKHKNRTIQIQ